MILWFASGNIHKKKELAAIISQAAPGAALEVKTPGEAGLDFEPEETGATFLENALLKANGLYRLLEDKRPWGYISGDPVIADDSGLCVDALFGRPGIYSARYGGHMSGGQMSGGPTSGGQISCENLSDTQKNDLLLGELGDNPLRSARFVCAMVLYYGPSRFFAAQETMEGELVKEAKAGGNGFGYDPILFLPNLGLTVADLPMEEKNRLSHRGKAARALMKFLIGT